MQGQIQSSPHNFSLDSIQGIRLFSDLPGLKIAADKAASMTPERLGGFAFLGPFNDDLMFNSFWISLYRPPSLCREYHSALICCKLKI
jgi:hypothetical protein